MPNKKPKRQLGWQDLVTIRPSLLANVQRNKAVSDHGSLQSVTYEGSTFSKKRVLRIDAPITHSMRLTLNGGLYQAKEMFAGKDSFTHPTKKPILHNHNARDHAIGRVQSVIYEPITSNRYPIQNAHLLDHEQTFRVIQDLMDKDILSDRDWLGLGALVATMHITDKDAIERYLDERSMNFSTRQMSDDLLDPRTGKSIWDGMFDDEGERDEEWTPPPFVVLGRMTYPEVSDVTIGADEYAFVREMKLITGGDNSELDFSSRNVDGMFNFEDTQQDTIEINSKPKEEKTQVRASGDKTMFDFKKIGDQSSPEEIYEAYKEIFKEKDLKDAVMSPEQIAALKGSAFCYSGRSMPIHDKAHLDAAHELLDRGNFSDSSKSVMKEFLKQKGSALGVNPAEYAKVNLQDLATHIEDFSNFDLATMLNTIAKEYVARDMDHSVLAQVTGFAEKEVQFVDQVSSLESQVKQLESANASFDDELNKLKVQACDRGKLSLSLLKSIKDNLTIASLEETIDEVKEFSEDQVVSELELLIKDSALLERINLIIDGHATSIDSTKVQVEDPTVTTDSEDNKEIAQELKDQYVSLYKKQPAEAVTWLNGLRDSGFCSAETYKALKSLTHEED